MEKFFVLNSDGKWIDSIFLSSRTEEEATVELRDLNKFPETAETVLPKNYASRKINAIIEANPNAVYMVVENDCDTADNYSSAIFATQEPEKLLEFISEKEIIPEHFNFDRQNDYHGVSYRIVPISLNVQIGKTLMSTT